MSDKVLAVLPELVMQSFSLRRLASCCFPLDILSVAKVCAVAGIQLRWHDSCCAVAPPQAGDLADWTTANEWERQNFLGACPLATCLWYGSCAWHPRGVWSLLAACVVGLPFKPAGRTGKSGAALLHSAVPVPRDRSVRVCVCGQAARAESEFGFWSPTSEACQSNKIDMSIQLVASHLQNLSSHPPLCRCPQNRAICSFHQLEASGLSWYVFPPSNAAWGRPKEVRFAKELLVWIIPFSPQSPGLILADKSLPLPEVQLCQAETLRLLLDSNADVDWGLIHLQHQFQRKSAAHALISRMAFSRYNFSVFEDQPMQDTDGDTGCTALHLAAQQARD